MRHIILFYTLMGIVMASLAQDNEDSRIHLNSNHELKLNMFNAAALRAIDINYEYSVNDNATVGIGVFHKYIVHEIESEEWFSLEVADNRKFAITPHFRRYFSKGRTVGFFIEGFMMLHSGREAYFDYVRDYTYEEAPPEQLPTVVTYESYTRFATGLAIGGKILLKKGFLMEFYTGLGANPLDEWSDMVTRGGISFGYRF